MTFCAFMHNIHLSINIVECVLELNNSLGQFEGWSENFKYYGLSPYNFLLIFSTSGISQTPSSKV